MSYLPLGVTFFFLHDAMVKLFLDYWDLPKWQRPFFVASDAILLAAAMAVIYLALKRVGGPETPQVKPARENPAALQGEQVEGALPSTQSTQPSLAPTEILR